MNTKNLRRWLRWMAALSFAAGLWASAAMPDRPERSEAGQGEPRTATENRASAADYENDFENDFERAALGSVPDDVLVLAGRFEVKQEADNQFLELPGAPLETFGLLFGSSAKEGLAVSARMYGTRQGRRFPVFAVSLGGVSGYRLQVTPAKNALELFKGDLVQTSARYDWTSGSWTHLRIRLRKVGESRWQVEGQAWKEGDAVPRDWMISLTTTVEPIQGRPGVWGSPFAGTPIRFDDLRMACP